MIPGRNLGPVISAASKVRIEGFIAEAEAAGARVLVDGLDAGPLREFRDNVGALTVLPGSHLIQIQDGTQILLHEKVFLSDGARRSLLVTTPKQ